MPIGVVQRDCRCPPPAGEGLKVEQDVVGVTALLVLVVVHIYQVKDHRCACLQRGAMAAWPILQMKPAKPRDVAPWHFIKQAVCTTVAGTGTIPSHLRTAVDRRGTKPTTSVRQRRLATRHDPRQSGYGGGSHAQKRAMKSDACRLLAHRVCFLGLHPAARQKALGQTRRVRPCGCSGVEGRAHGGRSGGRGRRVLRRPSTGAAAPRRNQCS